MAITMSHFVRKLAAIQDNTRHGNLKGRCVADLDTMDPEMAQAILDSGASRCITVSARMGSKSDPRIETLNGEAWDFVANGIEVAFFDCRSHKAWDPVRGFRSLIDNLRRSLTADGVLFAIVRTGAIHPGFDISNPIVQTVMGPLPTFEYFLEDLAKDCAVRILERLPVEAPGIATDLMRITPKKPTLLLILGRSQSGKTSLGRDLLQLDPHMHISNDYIYCEIARLSRTQDALFPKEVTQNIGDGSGVACGSFNRALERDPGLLKKYISLVERLIPRTKGLVSMDLDLVDSDQISVVASHFSAKGFSVWIVMRDESRGSAPNPAPTIN
jgi:hypothetical protein